MSGQAAFACGRAWWEARRFDKLEPVGRGVDSNSHFLRFVVALLIIGVPALAFQWLFNRRPRRGSSESGSDGGSWWDSSSNSHDHSHHSGHDGGGWGGDSGGDSGGGHSGD